VTLIITLLSAAALLVIAGLKDLNYWLGVDMRVCVWVWWGRGGDRGGRTFLN